MAYTGSICCLFSLAHVFVTRTVLALKTHTDTAASQSQSLRIADEARPQLNEHVWACKNGNPLRNGQSNLYSGPSDLSKPKWTWSSPHHTSRYSQYGHIETTPLIDRDSNIYIGTTTGRIQKLSKDGAALWAIDEPVTSRILTGALYGDSMYVGTNEGTALSIDLSTGHVNWRNRFAPMAGGDASSATVVNDTAIFAGANAELTGGAGGNSFIIALDTTDGSMKWTFSQPDKIFYNFMPVVSGDNVVFIDFSGNIYCVSLASGTLRWKSETNTNGYTTAGVAKGPGDLVYTTFNTGDADGGKLVAYGSNTGTQKWQRDLFSEASAAPAVGTLGPNGQVGVVVGVGHNVGGWKPYLEDAQAKIKAFDAQTGADLWTFVTPHQQIHGSKGLYSVQGEDSIPDTFSTPAIGKDGVVYVGWEGGRQFALNGTTGQMLSNYSNGYGEQGEPAIGNGFVVFASCGELIAF